MRKCIVIVQGDMSLYSQGHIEQHIIQNKFKKKRAMTETIFTLNPGIPGGPEGPGGQIAGHCRGQRQNTEVCMQRTQLQFSVITLRLKSYQKVTIEIMKSTRKTLR